MTGGLDDLGLDDLGLDRLGPDGLTWRRLRPSDAGAVYQLMAAAQVEDTGSVVIEEADIVGDWQRPSFDLATQSIGVVQGGRLVAYAEVSGARRADAAVHPELRGRGIGTALARWTQRIARRDGGHLVGQPVPQGSTGERLLRDLGYRPMWTSWVLQLPPGRRIEPQPIPHGYAVREAAGEADHRIAHQVLEDAFLEWSERDREPFEDFAAGTVRRPGFEPWHLRLMTAPTGAVVGVAFLVCSGDLAYVDRLAVRRDERGRGLARALLVDSFAVAGAHGAPRAELSTDSRTGALGLYLKVGMEVTSTWQHWAIDVGAGAPGGR